MDDLDSLGGWNVEDEAGGDVEALLGRVGVDELGSVGVACGEVQSWHIHRSRGFAEIRRHGAAFLLLDALQVDIEQLAVDADFALSRKLDESRSQRLRDGRIGAPSGIRRQWRVVIRLVGAKQADLILRVAFGGAAFCNLGPVISSERKVDDRRFAIALSSFCV